MVLAAKQHIRMISEGLCDTVDWSNDASNSALIPFEYLFKLKMILVFINTFKRL